MTCAFARFHDSPCDGVIDDAHWIPKQRLKSIRPPLALEELWDRRIVTEFCRHHHGLVDRKLVRLRADDFPQSVHEYASHHGLYFNEERGEWRVGA